MRKTTTPITFPLPADKNNAWVRAALESKISEVIKREFLTETNGAPAKIVLDQMISEFVMNAQDANAKNITVEGTIEEDQIIIKIIDDGKGVPSEKSGRYDWRKALFRDSDKKDKSGVSGGKNLGLAICAHFLEKEGAGQLSLTPRTDGHSGTIVTFSSTHRMIDDIAILEENLNYACMMFSDYTKENPREDIPEKFKGKFSLKHGERDQRLYEITTQKETPALSTPGLTPHSFLETPIGMNNSFCGSLAGVTSPTVAAGKRIKKPPSLFPISAQQRSDHTDNLSIEKTLDGIKPAS